MAAAPSDTLASNSTGQTLPVLIQPLTPPIGNGHGIFEGVTKRVLTTGPNNPSSGPDRWNVEKGELLAACWGLLSAFSLVLGAGVALLIKVGPKTMAMMMAFGGGALVEALSVELFGHMRTRHSLHEGALWVGVAAGALGGLIYYGLDRVLNSQGARERSAFYVRQMANNTVSTVATAWTKSFGEVSDVEKQPEQVDATQPEPDAHLERGRSAALAIWLGILLDGIPESLVIGLMSNHAEEQHQQSLMYAFVISVFVANFPEALSSAGTMKQSGMSNTTIMCMWTLIFLLTGIGAGIGSYVFPPGSDNRGTHLVQAAIEGTCGGAMLTMISNTIFPHAFEGGGGVIGLASLAGFLISLSVGVNAVTDEELRLAYLERWTQQFHAGEEGPVFAVANVNATSILSNVSRLLSHRHAWR